MKRLLINGCYDRQTYSTLAAAGLHRFGFDLRATSLNLVTFSELQLLMKGLGNRKVYLHFENDKITTIQSFLDLFKQHPDLNLVLRDAQSPEFYYSLQMPFIWMFHLEASWKEILRLPNLKGVMLPLKLKHLYSNLHELWDLIDQRNLEIIIHADSLSETDDLDSFAGINLSVDLNREIESSYRQVDQARLKALGLWRKINESPAL